MDQLLTSLQGMDQDQAVVLLFAGVLVAVTGAAVVAVVVRSLGRWGGVALCLALAAVIVVALLR